MAIDFDASRWERVKENSRKWWAGELKRPLIQIEIDTLAEKTGSAEGVCLITQGTYEKSREKEVAGFC